MVASGCYGDCKCCQQPRHHGDKGFLEVRVYSREVGGTFQSGYGPLKGSGQCSRGRRHVAYCKVPL